MRRRVGNLCFLSSLKVEKEKKSKSEQLKEHFAAGKVFKSGIKKKINVFV